jgi:hypothetical protein
MSAEFNWWLLIVGLVVGAGLTWLVVADARRRDEDLEESELAAEAAWLESATAELGTAVDAATAEQLLRLHRTYLGLDPEASGVEPGMDLATGTWWSRLDDDASEAPPNGEPGPAGGPPRASPPDVAAVSDPATSPGPRREPDPPVGTPG